VTASIDVLLRLRSRHPHRKQGYRNRRFPLPAGSILGIVNAVLMIQRDVGKKPIIESAKGGVPPFLVLPAQNGAQD
jgi:hypothetical protein